MSTTTDSRLIIAREWKISNPLPPIEPVINYRKKPFAYDFFAKYYRPFVNEILPAFEVDPNEVPSAAMQFLQEAFNQECSSPFLYEMMLRHYLLAVQKVTLALFLHPSLTKCAIVHSDLAYAAQLIRKRGLSTEIVNFCDMQLAEVLDLYQGSYVELLENKFWSKTKTGSDLINQFLTKEIEKLRLLHAYTFHQLASALMRKSIEAAPGNSVSVLMKWRTDNNIPLE